MDEKAHYIVVTGIVIKDGKYLLAKRSLKEAAFPGLWTVPGGKLNRSDYENSPKDTSDQWYNVLEKALARELQEEVGIKVKNVEYITSLATVHGDGPNSLVISFSSIILSFCQGCIGVSYFFLSLLVCPILFLLFLNPYNFSFSEIRSCSLASYW